MVVDLLRRIVDSNERDIARYRVVADRVTALEPQVQALTNEQLRARTDEFRDRVQSEWASNMEQLERDGHLDSERRDKTRKALDEVLDALLPEAFAVVREAARRTLGQRHFDVQLIGGMVAHDCRIAELKTGEGKTLMATLPLYLNALAGRGVHLVTANDYLSKVGAVWMGPIYHLLGMTVGIIQGQSPETGDIGGSYIFDPDYEDPDPRYTYCRAISRREAYACDITYGTNNEFGFDFLRDNMAFDAEELVMRDLHYAIVDEVDSILIDEARTPLIISGAVEEDTSVYGRVDRVVRTLRSGREAKSQQEKDDPSSDRNNPSIHYLVDEKAKTVSMTDAGVARLESALGVNNVADDPQLMHHITASMKSHALFKKDVDYVVRDGEIIIVDEFTGRLMFGRRYSDGLHQAIEAKENVPIKHESQTLATITFQNLFRLYLKLAGMTGTAKTEEDEFRKIYGLDVVVVPTHQPMIRMDQADVIYKRAEHKLRGIAAEILRLATKQQPVLVGTRSIEMSERVSSRITSDRLQVLGMVSIVRERMEASKAVEKAKREAWTEVLNSDLDRVTVGKLAIIARELGVPADPLADENLRALLRMLQLPEDDGYLERLRESLVHGIPHNVLNAKYHEKEAIIIAEAGRLGGVTIATNMAGRGVDIILGGKPQAMELPPGQDAELAPVSETPADNAEATGDDADDGEQDEIVAALSFRRGGKAGSVLDSVTTLTPEEHGRAADEVRARGGLFILGTERHESRRIDNQLRGRSGRQGDPGESRFYVSLEDELWRLFGDRTQHPLLRTWPDDQAMDARILSRMIARAQKKVEEHHFEMRKHVLRYDDVMNKQREIIYRERRRVLEGADLRDTILGFLQQTVTSAVDMFCPETERQTEWAIDQMHEGLDQYFPLSLYVTPDDLRGKGRDELKEQLTGIVSDAYERKEREVGDVTGEAEAMRDIERRVALLAINRKWMEHLANMDYLREGIGLRGYAQKDPILDYQREAFSMFEDMQHSIQDEIARTMFHVQAVAESPRPRREYPTFDAAPDDAGGVPGAVPAAAPRAAGRKLGRNDPCWCGSRRKYKHCHYPD
ncbi:MAG TPA: preprotein translocase subunit SecA [Chthonomonadales bacterium]|nr:preprotein translocase subunit SecA [Chthonomonadales bacterium]